MATTAKSIEDRLSLIERRNSRVEADKAWELSWTRRALIAVFTYIAIAAYLSAINIPNALLNAVVPTAAFVLATMTLPFFKKLWLGKFYAR